MARLRVRALSLLEQHGGMTARSIADALDVDRSAASRTIVRAHSAGLVHIANWLRTGYALAPLYAAGPGVDTIRPAPKHPNECSAEYRKRHPERHRAATAAWRERARRRTDVMVEIEPIVPVESCSKNPVLPAKEIVVSESVSYFEIDLLPGVQHFTCAPYKATLSIQSCADKFKQANSGDAFGRHAHCKRCPIGAAHGGAGPDLNLGKLKGATFCARCHRGATRLIGRHICVSCFNRARELRLGKNGKGTAPVRLAKLDRRSISYRAGGVVKTRVFEESVDMTELVVAVLRDEKHTPQFGRRAPASMDWLRDEDLYDRSIGDAVEVGDVPDVADSVQDAQEQAVAPIVASPLADVAVPVPAACDVVQADPAADVDVDPLQPLRDAVERLERDVPSPTMSSRRAAKRIRQQARRQVRVSNVTVQLMRTVGALPAPSLVVAPLPTPQTFYSASMFTD